MIDRGKPLMQIKQTPVSVIIPTFQEEKYLPATLSALTRVGPQVEIIVVDSGSSDRTVDIAKRFTRKVYRIHERGIAKGKNYGARKSKGDTLVFLDADVQPDPDFVTKVLRAFANREIVGATCNVMPQEPELTEAVFSGFYNVLIRFVSTFKPHSQGKFFAVRREAFSKVKGFNEGLPCLEDHDLAFRLSHFGKIAFIGDLTVYESPRRFRQKGVFGVLSTWMIDYFSFVIRGKPVSTVWPVVR
jgi:glycosyltransferase involved in cell wall biosynthesis